MDKRLTGALVTLAVAAVGGFSKFVLPEIFEARYPKTVTVTGTVLRANEPLKNADVNMDTSALAKTDDVGDFYFKGVKGGPHQLRVLDGSGRLIFRKAFNIREADADERDLGPLRVNSDPVSVGPSAGSSDGPYFPEQSPAVDNQIALTYRAAPITPEAAKDRKGNTQSIVASIGGPASSLALIESVTYYLHPTFDPSVVTKSSVDDNFALDFTAWGQFELRAKVYFRDGRIQDVSKFIAF
jgi:hypothetical protein